MSPDGISGVVQPLNERAAAVLATYQWPPHLIGGVVGLLQLAELTVLVVVMTLICAALQRAVTPEGEPPSGRLRSIVVVSASVVAVALFGWSVHVPSNDMYSLFARWDHLIFCAAAGLALAQLQPTLRAWILSALSAYFVARHGGELPFAVAMGTALCAYAVLRVTATASAGPTAALQAVVWAGGFLVCWRLRSYDMIEALKAQALYAYSLLRHISFSVEARRQQGEPSGPQAPKPSGLPHDRPDGLRAYLAYMLFYPSFIGASEVYDEFAARNLTGVTRYDYRRAAEQIIIGQLQVWASFQINVRFEEVILITDPLQLWGSVVLLFVRSALFVMGLWATIEGVAFLYGFELRPNFTGILFCQNPSQFWHSWRATMTNWLVHYVYIPLGGNRRRQAGNIAAAFAVSTAWHAMGIPFLARGITLWHFVPVALWGALNAAAVIAHADSRRHDIFGFSEGLPRAAVVPVKVLLTAVLGTFTVTLLTFYPQHMVHFASFMRTLIGLG